MMWDWIVLGVIAVIAIAGYFSSREGDRRLRENEADIERLYGEISRIKRNAWRNER